jgi:hypothetical protein
MGNDRVSEIDSTLAEELPDPEGVSETSIDRRKRDDLIRLLQYAADELGKSPTFQEFNSLDLAVSADIIKYAFGTWNTAKEAAGLETWQRGTVRDIDETYFQSIDSSEKAYWLGALLATSSLQTQPNGQDYILLLGRVEDKAYFVTAFADAIGSDYSIRWHQQHKSDKQQIQLSISNATFIEHLLAAGYPAPGADPGGFPVVDAEFRPPFLRGFLESSGYFSSNGWNVTVPNVQRAETLQEWFKQDGAKRVTVSQQPNGSMVVRVTNPFDITAIFESLWPEVLQTEPSWKPYPRKILQHLGSEHPYPENVPYLQE